MGLARSWVLEVRLAGGEFWVVKGQVEDVMVRNLPAHSGWVAAHTLPELFPELVSLLVMKEVYDKRPSARWGK